MPAPACTLISVAAHDQGADGDAGVHRAVVREVADRARRTGRAGWRSSSSMISMARIFGAPLTVPAGKVARTRSKASTPGRSRPSTCETMCMTCE